MLCFYSIISAQPLPGDLFKEYRWYNEAGDCNGALRVGGRLDYHLTEQLIDYRGEGHIQPQFDVDLRNAIAAELVIEKMLCHGDTEGLRVSINGRPPSILPEAQQIPRPQSAYAHHLNVIVPVYLDHLNEGAQNTFMFEVDTAGHWWPQNLIYGMILRIYYDPELYPERGRITLPSDGDVLGLENQIRIKLPEDQLAEKIDLIASNLKEALTRLSYANHIGDPKDGLPGTGNFQNDSRSVEIWNTPLKQKWYSGAGARAILMVSISMIFLFLPEKDQNMTIFSMIFHWKNFMY